MNKTGRGIAVYGPDDVRCVDDIPIPEIGPYECLLKIRSCGFCNGTDFDIIKGEMSIQVDGFPFLLGHEGVGEVIKVGKNVRNYHIGNRFINPPIRHTTSRYGYVWGQMEDYGVLQDWQAMKEDGINDDQFFPAQKITRQIPDDFDVYDAAVLLSLNESFSAARNFRVKDQDVLVYGAGPMGLATMKYMRYLGAKSITCIDCVPERLALAHTLSGVDRTINFKEENKKAALGDQRFDRVIDIVGRTDILMEGTQYLKPFGILGSMGVLKSTDNVLRVTDLTNNTLLQMLNFPYGQYDITDENIRLIQSGFINPKDFYNCIRKPEEIGDVLELVRDRKIIKAVIDFGPPNYCEKKKGTL